MPTVHRERGYRFSFWSNENDEPPHVHVEHGEFGAKFWLNDVELAQNYGFATHRLTQIQSLIEQHQTMMLPPRMDKREMTPLSPAQARVLLDTAGRMDDRWSALYVLAVTTGLRQGELLGLRWEDLDLGSATLRVRHTLQPPGFPKGAPARLTPPKTRRSLRSVHLPRSAVAALVRHRELQDAERSRSNGSWREQGLVFPNTLGTPMDYTNLVPRHFKPLLRRTGLPDIRFHDLRHTCATLLLTKGVHPKIVSEMLGHSSVSITLDVYSHMIPGLGEAAANAMEDVLGDEPGVGGVGGEAM